MCILITCRKHQAVIFFIINKGYSGSCKDLQFIGSAIIWNMEYKDKTIDGMFVKLYLQ